MPENAQDFIDSGPEWDPDVLPIKFAGTSIRWSKTGYDSVVIPLIVTCKQVFWDLRLDQFTVAGKELGMRIVCPCVYGRDSKLVALDGGDVEPRSVAAEIERVLNVVAAEVLSEPWSLRIEFHDNDRSETFEGRLAHGD